MVATLGLDFLNANSSSNGDLSTIYVLAASWLARLSDRRPFGAMIRLIQSEGYATARSIRFSITVVILAVTFGAAGWVYGQAAQGP